MILVLIKKRVFSRIVYKKNKNDGRKKQFGKELYFKSYLRVFTKEIIRLFFFFEMKDMLRKFFFFLFNLMAVVCVYRWRQYFWYWKYNLHFSIRWWKGFFLSYSRSTWPGVTTAIYKSRTHCVKHNRLLTRFPVYGSIAKKKYYYAFIYIFFAIVRKQ